jgi:hypothetical protein
VSILAIIACIISGTVSSVVAQGGGVTPEATEAFEKASAAFKEGKYRRALDLFIKANRLKYSWKIEYNIGQSAAAAKQWGIALSAFEKYLSLGGDDIDPNRESEVMKETARLKSKVGLLNITAADGARIFIDDFERGRAPLQGPLSVNASVEQKIRAELEDGSRIEKTFTGPISGQTISLDLTAPQKANEKPVITGPEKPEQTSTSTSPDNSSPVEKTDASKPTEPPRNETTGLKIAGFACLGVGAASLIAGAVTGGIALNKNGDLEKSCESNDCYSEDYNKLYQRDNLATASSVLLAVGGVAAAAGVGLVIFDRVKSKKSETQKAALQIGPGGLSIRGRF